MTKTNTTNLTLTTSTTVRLTLTGNCVEISRIADGGLVTDTAHGTWTGERIDGCAADYTADEYDEMDDALAELADAR